MGCDQGRGKGNGLCCDKCPKGEYMKTPCSTPKDSAKCAPCLDGLDYTEDDNNLPKCILCADCSSTKHLRKKIECLRDRNAQCECEEGFYCTDPKAESCTHCEVRTKCRPGQGAVNIGASEDTSCEPCPPRTFSNVTGYSPCLPHTNCGGQKVEQEGTDVTDAVCGKPLCTISHGYWLLPAGLWVGLIVSAFIIAAYFYWKAKHRSRHTVSFPDDCVVSVSPGLAPDILLPPQEQAYKNDCTEMMPLTCPVETSSISSCECVPSPTLTSQTSPMRLIHLPSTTWGPNGDSNGSSVCQSEPQEDEWNGT